MSNNTIGVLIMVKNEANSIRTTIDSVKKYINQIIILDTGSTDTTIENITKLCNRNNQKLYLKKTEFKNFPESRNEAIEFAETVNVDFLILMDAGDEFKTNLSKEQFYIAIKNISPKYNYGLTKHLWKVNNFMEEHSDVRFIRNKNNCRYDLRYLVHEKFKDVKDDLFIMNDIFFLYQDRDLYGISTKDRYNKDIENLLKSIPNQRNLYYLGQTYMNKEDYDNGYKINKLCWETEPDDDLLGEHILKQVLCRIGYCGMLSNKDENEIFKYLELAINTYTEPPIEAFIFLFSYAIDKRITNKVLKYIEKLGNLKKPVDILTTVNHNFYDYKRWNQISIVCLLSNQKLEIGKEACKIALQFGNADDKNNMHIYNCLSSFKR